MYLQILHIFELKHKRYLQDDETYTFKTWALVKMLEIYFSWGSASWVRLINTYEYGSLVAFW